jgi:arylsulfatase A-like enzyme
MPTHSTETDRPNVVLINCHDLGRQLGCYGWDVDTPNIDEMASDGVQFTNAFSTAPTCSPSRSSVTTGQYPHRNGMMGLAHRGWSLDDEVSTLPQLMDDAGYASHLFGFQHETDWSHPERLGYRHVHRDDDGRGHPPSRARSVAGAFADELPAMADDEEPFFATLGFVEPHTPFRRDEVPDDAYDRYDHRSIDPLPHVEFDDEAEREEHKRRLADFRSLVTATVDPAVGTVRSALRDQGIADETLIVFVTDHGEHFERGKMTCYDHGINIALLVDPPQSGQDGVRNETLVSNVDLFPTVLDVADAPVPDDIDGQSLVPTFETGEYEPRDRIRCEQTWHVTCKPVRAVRTDRFKYIRRFRPYAESKPGAGDGPPTHAFYDLEADPHERSNLASGDGDVPEEYESVFGELQTDLYRWMSETDDPLANGCLPMPGADRIDTDEEYPAHSAP